MTDHKTAPLTGDEIRAAVKHAHNMSGPSDATQPGEYVLAGALALLSKLRAEGVQAGDERAAFEADHLRRFNKPGLLGWDEVGMFAGTFGHALTRARWEGWQARAALASAPAASEADQPDIETLRRVCAAHDAARPAVETLNDGNSPVPRDGHSLGPLTPIYDHMGAMIGQIVAATRRGADKGSAIWMQLRRAGQWMPWLVVDRQSAPVADAAPEYAYSDDGKTVTMTNADRVPSYWASAPVAGEAQKPVAWAAVLSGGKRAGRVYASCDTREEIEAYIQDVHQSNDSLTLYARPLSFADAAPQSSEAIPNIGKRVGWLVQSGGSTTTNFPGVYGLPDGRYILLAIATQAYAASPDTRAASEAVRILFPTHLRTMWSGGEVQAWLDEHQGITPRKASAKGSLERYRKWQTEQARADNGAPCSCPTGDGSLRHPCAVHPTGDKDGGDCAKGAGGPNRDAVDAARYRLAASDCILVLRGDAALGRDEWDRKLDRLATQQGAK